MYNQMWCFVLFYQKIRILIVVTSACRWHIIIPSQTSTDKSPMFIKSLFTEQHHLHHSSALLLWPPDSY